MPCGGRQAGDGFPWLITRRISHRRGNGRLPRNDRREGDSIGAVCAFYLGSRGQSAREEGWSLAEKYFRQPRAKLSHLTPFFGTPDECARELQPYVDAGLTTIVARVITHDPLKQMRLLLEEVKPRLSPLR